MQWTPDLQPNEKSVCCLDSAVYTHLILTGIRVDAISALLDPSSTVEIDLVNLRMLCSHGTLSSTTLLFRHSVRAPGLPDYPPWLRPRVWR